jgi:hypothetical protein
VRGERIKAACGQITGVALKTRYDPTNLFRNQNIKPTVSGTAS